VLLAAAAELQAARAEEQGDLAGDLSAAEAAAAGTGSDSAADSSAEAEAGEGSAGEEGEEEAVSADGVLPWEVENDTAAAAAELLAAAYEEAAAADEVLAADEDAASIWEQWVEEEGEEGEEGEGEGGDLSATGAEAAGEEIQPAAAADAEGGEGQGEESDAACYPFLLLMLPNQASAEAAAAQHAPVMAAAGVKLALLPPLQADEQQQQQLAAARAALAAAEQELRQLDQTPETVDESLSSPEAVDRRLHEQLTAYLKQCRDQARHETMQQLLRLLQRYKQEVVLVFECDQLEWLSLQADIAVVAGPDEAWYDKQSREALLQEIFSYLADNAPALNAAAPALEYSVERLLQAEPERAAWDDAVRQLIGSSINAESLAAAVALLPPAAREQAQQQLDSWRQHEAEQVQKLGAVWMVNWLVG
jgi:hypothetical protein